MTERLRFAEAVCAGHPDRLADTIADRIVALATERDKDALVGVEVALHRNVAFVDGRIAAGRSEPLVAECDVAAIVRAAFRDAGYGLSPSGFFGPHPDALDVRTDLCLGPLPEDERAIRDVSDDQSISVGHAVWGPRAGHRPLEQALATDFAAALERLRRARPDLGLGPDGKTLVVVRDRTLVGVSLSVQHAARGVDWLALTRETRKACEAVASEYVEAGELTPLTQEVEWLVNGAGAFEIGGPEGDNGLSGKKLVAQAYGTSVPIGGGATSGKDARKVDPRGQALARALALKEVLEGRAREATVWLAYRPGDLTPRWIEVQTGPAEAGLRPPLPLPAPSTASPARCRLRSASPQSRPRRRSARNRRRPSGARTPDRSATD
jgi:S-adenosylmethionine synthetase